MSTINNNGRSNGAAPTPQTALAAFLQRAEDEEEVSLVSLSQRARVSRMASLTNTNSPVSKRVKCTDHQSPPPADDTKTQMERPRSSSVCQDETENSNISVLQQPSSSTSSTGDHAALNMLAVDREAENATHLCKVEGDLVNEEENKCGGVPLYPVAESSPAWSVSADDSSLLQEPSPMTPGEDYFYKLVKSNSFDVQNLPSAQEFILAEKIKAANNLPTPLQSPIPLCSSSANGSSSSSAKDDSTTSSNGLTTTSISKWTQERALKKLINDAIGTAATATTSRTATSTASKTSQKAVNGNKSSSSASSSSVGFRDTVKNTNNNDKAEDVEAGAPTLLQSCSPIRPRPLFTAKDKTKTKAIISNDNTFSSNCSRTSGTMTLLEEPESRIPKKIGKLFHDKNTTDTQNGLLSFATTDADVSVLDTDNVGSFVMGTNMNTNCMLMKVDNLPDVEDSEEEPQIDLMANFIHSDTGSAAPVTPLTAIPNPLGVSHSPVRKENAQRLRAVYKTHGGVPSAPKKKGRLLFPKSLFKSTAIEMKKRRQQQENSTSSSSTMSELTSLLHQSSSTIVSGSENAVPTNRLISCQSTTATNSTARDARQRDSKQAGGKIPVIKTQKRC